MPSTRASRAAFFFAGLGLLALALATLGLRERIGEEYLLWRLRRGDAGDREAAARRLERFPTRRSARALLGVAADEGEEERVREAARSSLDSLEAKGDLLEILEAAHGEGDRDLEAEIARYVAPAYQRALEDLGATDYPLDPRSLSEVEELRERLSETIRALGGER